MTPEPPPVSSNDDRLEPQSVDDFIRRGWTYHVQGDYQRSQDEFHKALEISPNSYEAQYGLGMSYKIQHQPEEAIKAFENVIRALQGSPDDADQARASMLRHMSKVHLALLHAGFTDEPAP